MKISHESEASRLEAKKILKAENIYLLPALKPQKLVGRRINKGIENESMGEGVGVVSRKKKISALFRWNRKVGRKYPGDEKWGGMQPLGGRKSRWRKSKPLENILRLMSVVGSVKSLGMKTKSLINRKRAPGPATATRNLLQQKRVGGEKKIERRARRLAVACGVSLKDRLKTRPCNGRPLDRQWETVERRGRMRRIYIYNSEELRESYINENWRSSI